MTVTELVKKGNFFTVKIKRFQVISFTLGFFAVNQIAIFWANYLTGRERLFDNVSLSILFVFVSVPILYFLEWLLVVYVASKFPKGRLKEKILKHPVATIIVFILFIAGLPYRLAGYWGGNPTSTFEVILYYAFIYFLLLLFISWISEKIFKKQIFQWSWYKKLIDKVFIIAPPLYKLILGLLVALFIFIILFLLITMLSHYSGLDFKRLFN